MHQSSAFNEVSRPLIFVTSPADADFDFLGGIKTAHLPKFLPARAHPTTMPVQHDNDYVHQLFVFSTHDIRLLFPPRMLNKFTSPPMVNTHALCLALSNMVLTLPQLMLYERRGGVNYVKSHIMPSALAVALIIMYDIGSMKRAAPLCAHADPYAFSIGASMAGSVLSCLDNFYARPGCKVPTTPSAANALNAELVDSTLNVLKSKFISSCAEDAPALSMSLGPMPSLCLRLSLPASIALLAVVLSTPELWSDHDELLASLPAVLSLHMNDMMPKNVEHVFCAQLMPKRQTATPHGAEIPIPRQRVAANLTAVALTSMHLTNSRYQSLKKTCEDNGFDLPPPLPSDLSRLISSIIVPGAHISNICEMSDDDLYIAHFVANVIEEVIHYFIFRDHVLPRDEITAALDLITPGRRVDPLSILDILSNVAVYKKYTINPDTRLLACIDPQSRVCKYDAAQIKAIVAAVENSPIRARTLPAAPVWPAKIRHISLEETPLRVLAPGYTPVHEKWSALDTVAHMATLGGYTLLRNLSPGQVRYMVLLRHLARQAHQSCLLGAHDRLFDMETDSTNGLVLLTSHAMRLLMLYMTNYSKSTHYTANTAAVALARELLCLPTSAGTTFESEADARFADEVAFMLMCNMGRRIYATVRMPEGCEAPEVARYGFTRINMLYKTLDAPNRGWHTSCLALPLFEYMIRPLLLKTNNNHRNAFSRTNARDVVVLAEWMSMMSETINSRNDKPSLPSVCIQQLVVRFAYLERTGQLVAASGQYTPANILRKQNRHMVHAICMLALSMYNSEFGAMNGRADPMSEFQDDPDAEHDADAEHDINDISESMCADACTYADAEGKIPLWQRKRRADYIVQFHKIPVSWFQAMIIGGDAELQRRLDSDKGGASATFAFENNTERAAALSATLGICFGDFSSTYVRDLAHERATVRVVTKSKPSATKEQLIGDIKSIGGRTAEKISRAYDGENVPMRKRKSAINPRQIGAIADIRTNLQIVDKLSAEGFKPDARTKNMFERFSDQHMNFAAAQVTFEKICCDHSIVTGMCPPELQLVFTDAAVRHRAGLPNRWYYLFHLSAFILSWSLHAEQLSVAGPVAGERINIIPDVLFRHALHSITPNKVVGKHTTQHRRPVDNSTSHSVLNVAIHSPPQLFDSHCPWTLNVPPGTLESDIKDVIAAVAWLEAAPQTSTPEIFLPRETVELPDNWLGSALPMVINRKLLRAGADWPSLPLTNEQFTEKYFDLVASEELRNTALIMNNAAPNIGVVCHNAPLLRPFEQLTAVYDEAHTCCANCLAHSFPVGHKDLSFLLTIAHLGRQSQGHSPMDAV